MRRYGQTGSGKTYTLLGTSDQPGVVPRAFERLGEALNEDMTMHVTVSMVSSDKHPRCDTLHDAMSEFILPFLCLCGLFEDYFAGMCGWSRLCLGCMNFIPFRYLASGLVL